MDLNERSLRDLESLLTEFFNASTSNDRKREIEAVLSVFSSQSGAWQHCLRFFRYTSNEFVLMYCLNVLETVINRQWLKMEEPNKVEMRTTLYNFLLSQQHKVPNYISNKLGKLIVDIGRLDWPHIYPEFFTNIHQLSQASETAPLGLMLIQTTFEELTSPREDLSMSRREELQKLLLEQVPIVLNIICGQLEAILDKHCRATSTPPPSPTQFAECTRASLFSTSPLHAGSLLNSIFKCKRKNPFHPIPALDSDSHQLCVLSLKCLAQLLSWMPLSSFVTSSLLTTVFHFASFGCNPDPKKLIGASSSVSESNTDLGIQAMSCINEIMCRNCIPNDFEEFLVQMFQDTFHLMQDLTKDNPTGVPPQLVPRVTLSDISESFAEKFTDFLSLFVSLHLKRFEGNSQFPVLEFLALLFKYTFQQPTYEGFFSCVDIWNTFLDYISVQLRSRDADSTTVLQKYEDALLALLHEIFRKMQFKYNQSRLEELNDDDLDDDSTTEWQHFLRICLELISKVCDIIPQEVFKLIFSAFDENMHIYHGLEHYAKVSGNSNQIHLAISAENECRRLHCSLRDLSSILQAVGRLVEQMCGEEYNDRKILAYSTLERLCHTANYSNRLKFYNMATAAPLLFRADFTEVHAQVLATIKAFCQWLTLFNKETGCVADANECTSIETAIADVAVPNVNKEAPLKVAHSASHVLLSLTATVRPAFLYQLPCVQKLFGTVCDGELQFLPMETQLLVYRSMSNMMTLPWSSKPDQLQQWALRSTQHNMLVHSLSAPLKSAINNPAFIHEKVIQELAKPGIKWSLKVQSDLIENIIDAPTRTKQLFHQSIQSLISTIESLFHIYLNQSDVSECILDFFLALFTALKVQIGNILVEQTIQNFLNLFTTNQLITCILSDGTSGNKVVQKLLQLLQRLIQDPASQSYTYIPNTLSLCMDQIYPVIATRSSCEVKPVLFDLLFNILLHNWRYFFKSPVLISFMQSSNEVVENQDVLSKTIEAFGQSFLLPDIILFRQNLAALETLNNKWKLYHKGFFKSRWINCFLTVLIQCLIQKSHNLLQDEITATVYSMAAVDFESFFACFLPEFLHCTENLDANQKNVLLRNFASDVDLPSFTHNTKRFVCDLRYYTICNVAIP